MQTDQYKEYIDIQNHLNDYNNKTQMKTNSKEFQPLGNKKETQNQTMNQTMSQTQLGLTMSQNPKKKLLNVNREYNPNRESAQLEVLNLNNLKIMPQQQTIKFKP